MISVSFSVTKIFSVIFSVIISLCIQVLHKRVNICFVHLPTTCHEMSNNNKTVQLTTNEYLIWVQHSSSITSHKASKSAVVNKTIIEIPETIKNTGIFGCNGQSDKNAKPEMMVIATLKTINTSKRDLIKMPLE